MTISVIHTFQSAKAQGADSTLVSKNEWNAEHTYNMATGKLIGRTTAGTGTFEEITPTSTDLTLSGGVLSLAAPENCRILSADITGSDVNTAQAVFDSPTGFSAGAASYYVFEANYHILRSAGTTSHTTGVLFGGTATFTKIRYLAQVTNPTGNALANVQQIEGEAATLVTLTAANTSATENLLIKLSGSFLTNGAGTIIPQFQYSAATGGAPTIKAHSFFRVRKIASVSAGSWA